MLFIDYARNLGIIGHDEILTQLTRLTTNARLPHALLFSGNSAVGKRSVAEALGSYILTGAGGTKAGKALPDLHLCSAENANGDVAVEQIRDLRLKLQLRPFGGQFHVAIIDEAHRMTAAAANALLKTLEEPSERVRIILVTSAANRLPETIRSRCQTFHFGTLKHEHVQLLLKRLFAGICDDAILEECAGLAEGSLAGLGPGVSINKPEQSAKRLSVYFQQLQQRVTEYNGLLAEALSSHSVSTQLAVVDAVSVASEKPWQAVFWGLLRRALRERMCKATGNEAMRWAELLEQSLNSQRMVEERNLSMPLAVSTLLLECPQ